MSVFMKSIECVHAVHAVLKGSLSDALYDILNPVLADLDQFPC